MGFWVLILLIGLVVIGAGIRESAHQRRLPREGIQTEGLVIRHHRTSGGWGRTVDFAVVTFADAQGTQQQFRSRVSGVKGLPVGCRAPVLYLPGAPQTARIDLASNRLASTGVPLVVGIALTAAAIWMLGR